MTKRVLLVTSIALPQGEPHGHLLLDAFARRGIDARWVAWDNAGVDWAHDLVAVRSTWDYDTRLAEFLAWSRSVPRLLNGSDVFSWNTDKAYLLQLADAGVPVVPTVLAQTLAELTAARARFGTPVVKPRVGAGGRGVVVGRAESAGEYGEGPWIIQPLIESVRTEGEVSIFVLGGEVVSMARKLPAAGEIRVHEQYGGRSSSEEMTEEAAGLARAAVSAAESVVGRLDYARVDAMRLADGILAVSELELTEPGLYLDVLPGNAALFADLVQRRLGARQS